MTTPHACARCGHTGDLFRSPIGSRLVCTHDLACKQRVEEAKRDTPNSKRTRQRRAQGNL